jgi:hypothetical protein
MRIYPLSLSGSDVLASLTLTPWTCFGAPGHPCRSITECGAARDEGFLLITAWSSRSRQLAGWMQCFDLDNVLVQNSRARPRRSCLQLGVAAHCCSREIRRHRIRCNTECPFCGR